MTIKDPYQRSKYIEQNREVVYQRAKFNLVYLTVLLLISPLYLFVDFPTFSAMALIWLGTIVSLGVMTLISKFRRFGTEFILTSNIIVRGLLMNYIMRSQ